MQGLALLCNFKTRFIGEPSRTEGFGGFVQARQLIPELGAPRRDEDHVPGDVHGAAALAGFKCPQLDVVLEPQEHVRVAHRFERRLRIPDTGPTQMGLRSQFLDIEGLAPIEWIEQYVAAGEFHAQDV